MGSKEPTPENYTLLQGFEWNCPEDGKHYQRLTTALPQLQNIGIRNIWLPPGCKASSTQVAFHHSKLEHAKFLTLRGQRL